MANLGAFLGGAAQNRLARQQGQRQDRGLDLQERSIAGLEQQDLRAQAGKNIEDLMGQVQQLVGGFQGDREQLIAEMGPVFQSINSQVQGLAEKAGLQVPGIDQLIQATPTATEAIELKAREAGAVASAEGAALNETLRDRVGIDAQSAGAARAAQLDAEMAAAVEAQSLGVVADPEKTFDDAKDLRKEFTNATKVFVEVRDSFQRILSSGQDTSAAGDLALIFNFMKMLDPGSVVRESEFATAANSAGVPEQIRAQYNRVINGKRLGKTQRADFINRATQLFNGQRDFFQADVTRFSDLATSFGVDPDLVVRDLTEGLSDSNKPADESVTISIDTDGKIIE